MIGTFEAQRRTAADQPRGLLVDGRLVEGRAEDLAATAPSIGRELTRFAAGDAQDVDDAVRAARQAFDTTPWSRFTPLLRQEALQQRAGLVEDRAGELGLLDAPHKSPLITAE